MSVPLLRLALRYPLLAPVPVGHVSGIARSSTHRTQVGRYQSLNRHARYPAFEHQIAVHDTLRVADETAGPKVELPD